MSKLAFLLALIFCAPLFSQPVTLKLALFVDGPLFDTLGADTHDEVIQMVDTIRPVFLSQLNIELSITTVLIADDFDTPVDFTSGNAQLLFDFRSYMQTNWAPLYDYDACILLHDYSIGGAAYPGGSCNSAIFRYGHVQYLGINPTTSAKLLAHELGHMLGADHDDLAVFGPGGDPYLMWLSVSGSTLLEFSPDSVSEIENFLATADCFDDPPVDPHFWFRRGDPNDDGNIDVTDATAIVDYAFGGVDPFCINACDVDDNLLIDTSDAIYLLNYVFSGGPPPAFPFLAYGFDVFDPFPCGVN